MEPPLRMVLPSCIRQVVRVTRKTAAAVLAVTICTGQRAMAHRYHQKVGDETRLSTDAPSKPTKP